MAKSQEMAKRYLAAKDISQWLGISLARSYKMIRDGNEVLAKRGKYTMSNLISKSFLVEWLGLEDDNEQKKKD